MEKDMLILMDDGKHHAPTRRNIVDAFTRVTQYSEAGDIVFVHYSGHGGRVRDDSSEYILLLLLSSVPCMDPMLT